MNSAISSSSLNHGVPTIGGIYNHAARQPKPPADPTKGKQIDGSYLGFQACHYVPGNQNATCSGIVRDKINAMKEAKTRKKPSAVVVTVSNNGLNFQFSEAAKFFVEVKDIASMSLCPKGKSGKLKIAAVLCRASSKRQAAGVKPGSSELDMICHVWRPSTADALWDFYAVFESMLKNRGVNDPYLQCALAPAVQASQFVKKEVKRSSVLDHFEKTGIDRLEALMDSISTKDNETAKTIVKPTLSRCDSDISIELSDDEDSDNDSEEDDNNDTSRPTEVVTLSEDTGEDAEC